MKIEVNVADIDLGAVINYSEHGGATTLADMVAAAAVQRLTTEGLWMGLVERVRNLRDEEIRAQIEPTITEAIRKSVQRTTPYGEPAGEPVSMREIIMKEARTLLEKPVQRPYSGDRTSWIENLVRNEVHEALRTELRETIEEEREKMRARVQLEAGALIAEAVSRAIGK